jgi:hypothetical protein
MYLYLVETIKEFRKKYGIEPENKVTSSVVSHQYDVSIQSS